MLHYSDPYAPSSADPIIVIKYSKFFLWHVSVPLRKAELFKSKVHMIRIGSFLGRLHNTTHLKYLSGIASLDPSLDALAGG